MPEERSSERLRPPGKGAATPESGGVGQLKLFQNDEYQGADPPRPYQSGRSAFQSKRTFATLFATFEKEDHVIKIKVSYDRPEQLTDVIRRLGDAVLSCRRANQEPEDEHKRAYIILKD